LQCHPEHLRSLIDGRVVQPHELSRANLISGRAVIDRIVADSDQCFPVVRAWRLWVYPPSFKNVLSTAESALKGQPTLDTGHTGGDHHLDSDGDNAGDLVDADSNNYGDLEI
jgi:hypothetical protein